VNILMIAPQPFFRARGTPFSILQRLRGLTDLGHTVELVTYPFGEDIQMPRLRIHRSARIRGVRDVPIGPSFAKILLDVPLFVRARELAASGRFDLIHSHEEAGMMGAWLSRRYGIPHLYDMHSSLPEQFANFGRYNWSAVVGLFRRLENYTLERTDLLISVCPELNEHVERAGFTRPHTMIENTLEVGTRTPAWSEVERMRDELGLRGKRVIVYTGTLESYQGMDLLVQAAGPVGAAVPDAHFLVVGGTAGQVDELGAAATNAGVRDRFTLLPAVDSGQVPVLHRLASSLVTCRLRGINTPLKLYQYLRAGRPIVATAIRSHTQVLDASCAELVPVSAEGIARGLVRILRDPVRADAIAAAAAQLAEERYSGEVYVRKLSDIMARAESLVGRARSTPHLEEANAR
jgi:glycosyltransferase involved in cell wall biosynthesis